MTRSGYILPRIVLLMSIAFSIAALTAYSVVFGDEPITKTGSGALTLELELDSPAGAAKEEPVTFESLENQFEKEFLAAVAKAGEKALTGPSMKIGFELSKAIYGKHPEVLKAEAERRLAALPRIEESAWSQCNKEEIPNELLQIMPPIVSDGSVNPLYHRGWDPAFVATMIKQSILVKKIGIEDLGRSAQIAHFIPPKVFVVKDMTPTTIAIRQADGYFLVGMELTDQGVFRPISATWMHKKAEK